MTITGWGMFWAGLFGVLALLVLSDIVTTALNCHAITKAVKHLSKIDPETITKLIEMVVGKYDKKGN